MGAVTERLELGVQKTDAEKRAAAKVEWEAKNRQDKIADLRKRTDNMVPGDNADDAALNALHAKLTGMGH